MTERELRDGIVEVGRRLYARGYTASNDGNISVRLDAGRLLMTPKSVCKGFMTAEMMVVTDLEGKPLAGDDAGQAELFDPAAAPALVFDHAQILADYRALRANGQRPAIDR